MVDREAQWPKIFDDNNEDEENSLNIINDYSRNSDINCFVI